MSGGMGEIERLLTPVSILLTITQQPQGFGQQDAAHNPRIMTIKKCMSALVGVGVSQRQSSLKLYTALPNFSKPERQCAPERR